MRLNKVATWMVSLLAAGSLVLGQGPGGGPGSGGDHTGDPGSYRGHGGLELEHNLVLPQIAVGTDISTTITLTSLGNPQVHSWLDEDDLRTTGTVYFFAQNGSPLSVQVNGAMPASEHPFQLEPASLLVLDVTLDGPNTPGWALVVVDEDETTSDWGMRDGAEVHRGERLMGTAFYTVTGPQGALVSRVSVVPAVYEREHFLNAVMVAQLGGGANTGVAFVNTGTEEMAIRLHLRDSEGMTVADTMLNLAGGRQMAQFIDELFPGMVQEGFQGTLEISTQSEGLVSMGLLMTNGILTSIPTHHFGQWQRHQGMMP